MYEDLKSPIDIQIKHYRALNVEFRYPSVCGLRDRIVQHKINYRIIALMHEIISDLINPYSDTYVSGFFEIKTNERMVLSITLNAMADFGGAHPMTVIKSLSFDVKTGESYELSQLFKPSSHYIKILSDMICKQIEERDIPLLGEFKGISPDQDYFIADKCLIVYFQLYEITPYVAGFPYFPIPIYSISDIIAPDSILDRMLYWL